MILPPRLNENPRLEDVFTFFLARAHLLESPLQGRKVSGQEHGRLCPRGAEGNGIGNGGWRHDDDDDGDDETDARWGLVEMLFRTCMHSYGS